MDVQLRAAVIPLLAAQRRSGKLVSLDECIEQARYYGVRVDLVILLVRHELPLVKFNGSGLFRNFVVDALNGHSGGIYYGDAQALEAVHLVAQALGETLTVRLVGGGNPPLR